MPKALDFLFFDKGFQLLSRVHNRSKHLYSLALMILVCAYSLYKSMLLIAALDDVVDRSVNEINSTVACSVVRREQPAKAALVEK